MLGSTLKYIECLRNAQTVVDGLAPFGRHLTSVVVRFDEGKGLRYEIDGSLTIEYLSRSWESQDIQLLVFILRHPRITDWKLVNSAKSERI